MDAFGSMVQGSFLTHMSQAVTVVEAAAAENRTGKPYAAHLSSQPPYHLSPLKRT